MSTSPLAANQNTRDNPCPFIDQQAPMDSIDQPSRERSQLSGRYTDNGTTVIVEIFKPSGSSPWHMEVTSLEEQATDWNETFASDQEAWDEFIYVVNTEGISVFL